MLLYFDLIFLYQESVKHQTKFHLKQAPQKKAFNKQSIYFNKFGNFAVYRSIVKNIAVNVLPTRRILGAPITVKIEPFCFSIYECCNRGVPLPHE